MRLEPFALERSQSIREHEVAWNVSESGVHPLRVAEPIDTPELQYALLAQGPDPDYLTAALTLVGEFLSSTGVHAR